MPSQEQLIARSFFSIPSSFTESNHGYLLSSTAHVCVEKEGTRRSGGNRLVPCAGDGPDQHGSMHNMFVTRPPCKSLGIYIIHSPVRFEKLACVDAACGIRAKQLLEAIYECAPTAVKCWQGQAQSLRKAIASLDTTSKAQVTVPGFPKVFLFLEMHLHEPKPGHVTAMFANLASDMYFFGSKSKNVWEDEWMNGDQDKQDKQWSK